MYRHRGARLVHRPDGAGWQGVLREGGEEERSDRAPEGAEVREPERHLGPDVAEDVSVSVEPRREARGARDLIAGLPIRGGELERERG